MTNSEDVDFAYIDGLKQGIKQGRKEAFEEAWNEFTFAINKDVITGSDTFLELYVKWLNEKAEVKDD